MRRRHLRWQRLSILSVSALEHLPPRQPEMASAADDHEHNLCELLLGRGRSCPLCMTFQIISDFASMLQIWYTTFGLGDVH